MLEVYRLLRWSFQYAPVAMFCYFAAAAPWHIHPRSSAGFALFFLTCAYFFWPKKLPYSSPVTQRYSVVVGTLSTLALMIVLLTGWFDPIYWFDRFNQRLLAGATVALASVSFMSLFELWTARRQAALSKLPGFEVRLPNASLQDSVAADAKPLE